LLKFYKEKNKYI